MLTLIWSVVPGHTYRVQYAPFVGSQIRSDLPVAPVTATDAFTGATPQRFYRVLLQQ